MTRDAPSAGGRAERDPVAPSTGSRFWAQVFGREAPVEVEIGSGDGTFLVAAAAHRPDVDFFGLERSPSKARRLAARVARAERSERPQPVRRRHLRSRSDTVGLGRRLPHLFPGPVAEEPATLAAGSSRRRWSSALARTLVPSGQLLVATDVYGYLLVMRAHILADPSFEERAGGADHPGYGTAFARKYRAAGRAVYAATFERRST